jgi:hypothetical protein
LPHLLAPASLQSSSFCSFAFVLLLDHKVDQLLWCIHFIFTENLKLSSLKTQNSKLRLHVALVATQVKKMAEKSQNRPNTNPKNLHYFMSPLSLPIPWRGSLSFHDTMDVAATSSPGHGPGWTRDCSNDGEGEPECHSGSFTVGWKTEARTQAEGHGGRTMVVLLRDGSVVARRGRLKFLLCGWLSGVTFNLGAWGGVEVNLRACSDGLRSAQITGARRAWFGPLREFGLQIRPLQEPIGEAEPIQTGSKMYQNILRGWKSYGDSMGQCFGFF